MRVARLLVVGVLVVGMACSESTYGGGGGGGGGPTANQVFMQNTAFNPTTRTVPVGTTVTWVNQDPFAHTTTSNTGAWDSGSVASGGSFPRVFNTAGNFPYHCTIHGTIMSGTIVVQ